MRAQMYTRETRALGWYALRWTYITDWYKGRVGARKQSNYGTQVEVDKSSAQAAGETNKEAEVNKLKSVVKEAQGILATAKTAYQLFPDSITIDRHKLTICYRHFFGSAQSVGVPIENIKNIQADVGPLFGSLTITSDHFINNTQTIHGLKRKDAQRIQKLVQGVMVANKENIDLSKIKPKDLNKLLSDLGHGHID